MYIGNNSIFDSSVDMNGDNFMHSTNVNYSFNNNPINDITLSLRNNINILDASKYIIFN